MLLNKQWVMDYQDAFEDGSDRQTAIVAEHIDFLAKNIDPNREEPYLRM